MQAIIDVSIVMSERCWVTFLLLFPALLSGYWGCYVLQETLHIWEKTPRSYPWLRVEQCSIV